MTAPTIPSRYRWRALTLAPVAPLGRTPSAARRATEAGRRPRARCGWCGRLLFNGSRSAACSAHLDVEREYLRTIGLLS